MLFTAVLSVLAIASTSAAAPIGGRHLEKRFSNNMIKITNTNMCFDVPDANAQQGTPIQLWECHGNANQRWTFGDRGVDGALRWAAHPELCAGRESINGNQQPQLVLVRCDDPSRIEMSAPLTGSSEHRLCGPEGDGCVRVGGAVQNGAPLIMAGVMTVNNINDFQALDFVQ